MNRSNLQSRDWAIGGTGLILILLSLIPSLQISDTLRNFMQQIGIGMSGYIPIQILIYFNDNIHQKLKNRTLDKLFLNTVQIINPEQEKPFFIALDIEGCITPHDRSVVDLRKLQKLRGYCEFAKVHDGFPSLVIFTGRSQGYVELLAQCLGVLNNLRELPWVIENGCALYKPNTKTTEHILDREQIKNLSTARDLLTCPGNMYHMLS